MASAKTISQQLANHVVATSFDNLSPLAIAMTKCSLLDAVGVSLGASSIGEGSDAFVQQALAQGSVRQATILGYGEKVSATLAAFANGALAHALDFEDAYDGAPVHPNAQTVPVVLALAESLPKVSGRELITALAIGCDLTCRLGTSLDNDISMFGWYPPPILGAFGATAAAAKLLGLNVEQTIDAFSLTLCQATCSAEIKYNPDSIIRAVRDAFAAQVALQSAQLAQRGVRGFNQPFEGKAGFFNAFARGAYRSEVLLQNLGKEFLGEQISFKPWPACRGTHAFIDAAQVLLAENQLSAGDIASAHLIGSKVQQMLYEPQIGKRRPTTAIDAKFSLPFTIATALIHGDVTLASYSAAALRNTDVLELATRITFEIGDNARIQGNATYGLLQLTTRDGRRFEKEIANPRGAPSRPMSEAALLAKFSQCAGYARKPLPSIDAASDAILGLELLTDVRAQLMTHLS